VESHAEPLSVKYAFCPIHNFFRPWWKPFRSTDRVHALYTRAYTSCTRTGQKLSWSRTLWRRIKVVVQSIVWPLFCVVAAMRTTFRYGARVKEIGGKSRGRQFIEQVVLGLSEGIPPRSYYLFTLFEDRNRQYAAEFLHYHENNYLSAPFVSATDRQIIDDKMRFHDFCRDLSLPTPPVLACFRGGQYDGAAELPPVDLIVKPLVGYGGARIERWEWREDGGWSSRDNVMADANALFAYLREMSMEQPCLVQPRLYNHAALRVLSTGTLCTARMVTTRSPGGAPRLIAAMLRMPVGESVVDNFTSGGIASPLDLQTGALTGPAVTWAPLSQRYHTHPDTGHRIAGVTLPDWDAATQICVRAHDEVKTGPAIGWDIAFTPKGPTLMEGNLPFGIELTQFVTGAPLLGTAYMETLIRFDALWDRSDHHFDASRL